VILVYFGEEGQEGYGWSVLGTVLASIIIQILLCVTQYGKAGWRKLLQEMLIAVLGLKPAVDAFRVVSNAKPEETQVMDAHTELVFTKGIEMFCESIPGETERTFLCVPAAPLTPPPLAGCVIQVLALFQGRSTTKLKTKVFSNANSALTTGMASASISCACAPNRSLDEFHF
jgi:hypothetical protein